MKKRYRMAVGACGPNIMYTNIIKADSPEEAAKIYLEALETDGEEKIEEVASRMMEIEGPRVRGEDESIVDSGDRVLEIGDKVAVIANRSKNEIVTATVKELKRSSVIVTGLNGTDMTYHTDQEDGVTIKKAVKLAAIKVTDKTDVAKDALGQEIVIDQACAYRLPIYVNSCKGFGYGIVRRMTPSNVYIEIPGESELQRKMNNNIVMING